MQLNDTQKQLSLQGKMAIFLLKCKTNEINLNTKTVLSLFDIHVEIELN